MPADTSIAVSDEVWNALMRRKQRGDTFDDVLRRELGMDESDNGDNTSPEPKSKQPIGGEINELLEQWEPKSETNADRAREETKRAVSWLRQQNEPKSRREISDACAHESELGERSWWERAVQPGLRYLANNGHVKYRPGYHDYEVVETEP